jgi:hypothetical protein
MSCSADRPACPPAENAITFVNGAQRRFPPVHLTVEAGIVDHDTRRRRQAHGELLVEIAEDLRRCLIGQVQVPEHLTADHDRHTEER